MASPATGKTDPKGMPKSLYTLGYIVLISGDVHDRLDGRLTTCSELFWPQSNQKRHRC